MTKPKFTAEEEKAARVIAMARGTDPDAPVTIGNTDGSADYFEIGWHGYVPMARLIAQALDPKQPDPPLAREAEEETEAENVAPPPPVPPRRTRDHTGSPLP